MEYHFPFLLPSPTLSDLLHSLFIFLYSLLLVVFFCPDQQPMPHPFSTPSMRSVSHSPTPCHTARLLPKIGWVFRQGFLKTRSILLRQFCHLTHQSIMFSNPPTSHHRPPHSILTTTYWRMDPTLRRVYPMSRPVCSSRHALTIAPAC